MTDTDICNMALSYIGKGVISNMEEEQENARACKLYYETTRRQILRECIWGFAHRIERLAKMDIDIPGWEYVYGYPAECLKINKLTEEVPDYQTRQYWDIYNVGSSIKVVAAHLENAYIDYTWDVKDPNLWDDIFVQAFAHLLASRLAQRLVGNPQLVQQEYQFYQATIMAAKTQDAREEEPRVDFRSSYIEARKGGFVNG